MSQTTHQESSITEKHSPFTPLLYQHLPTLTIITILYTLFLSPKEIHSFLHSQLPKTTLNPHKQQQCNSSPASLSPSSSPPLPTQAHTQPQPLPPPPSPHAATPPAAPRPATAYGPPAGASAARPKTMPLKPSPPRNKISPPTPCTTGRAMHSATATGTPV